MTDRKAVLVAILSLGAAGAVSMAMPSGRKANPVVQAPPALTIEEVVDMQCGRGGSAFDHKADGLDRLITKNLCPKRKRPLPQKKAFLPAKVIG